MSALDVLSEYISSPHQAQRLTEALEYAFRNADSSFAQALIRHLKQTIKQRRLQPSCKLRALQALALGLATDNQHIRTQVAHKMLSRLMKIAKSRSSLRLEARGAGLFGEQSDPTERQASAEFLTLLLTSLKTWAEKYSQTPDGAAFARVYHMLLRDKVQFPKEIRPQTQLYVSAVQTLERLLESALPDPAELEKTVEALNQQAKCIELALKEESSSSAEGKQYVEAGNSVTKALQMYQNWLKQASFHNASKPSDIHVEISKIPRNLRELRPVHEPNSLPEPSNPNDSSDELGFFFDFESDINQEAQSSKVDFMWDEPDTTDLKAEWEAAKGQVAYLEEKIGEYRTCLDAQERQIGRKVADIEDIQIRIAAVEGEKAVIQRQLVDFQAQLTASEKELSACRDAVKAKAQEDSKQASALEGRIRQAKTDLAQSQAQLEVLSREQADLTVQTAAAGPLAKELADKEEEVRLLEEKWTKLQAGSKELAEIREETIRKEKEIKAKEAAASEGVKLTYEIQKLQAELQVAESESAAIEAAIKSTLAQVSEQETVLTQTLRESQEAQEVLHYSRTESAKRAVEDLASRLSISSHDAIPARNESPDRLNHSISPLSTPIYPKISPLEDDEDIEAEDEDPIPNIENPKEHRKGYFLSQGLLFSSPHLQVGFQRMEGKLLLAICNACDRDITKISFDFIDCPAGVKITPAAPCPSHALRPAVQLSQTFALACTKPFTLAPKVDIAYSLNASRFRVVIAVPLGILHFCEPFLSQTESIEQQWTDLAPFQSQATLDLYPFIKSLKTLADLLSGPGNLLICAPNEANWLQTGELMATGKALNREIMVQITAMPLRKCSIVLRCIPIRLRESILDHLACLLGPPRTV